jgi:hypothetical protein
MARFASVHTRIPVSESDLNRSHGPERRRKLRICAPIPVRVQGMDRAGVLFDQETSLDNLSARGLFLRLCRPVAESAKLSFRIHLTAPKGTRSPGMLFKARGIVRRVEVSSEGTFGLGVELISHRQLFDEQV